MTASVDIRDISDTARWAAAYRARETLRADALFRDPFAARLAGSRGEQMARKLPAGTRGAWGWITRTYLFDRIVLEQVAAGVDLIINLAAGLDARPYRLNLPRSLRWVEVDLPELLSWKDAMLAGETPGCDLQTVPMNLADRASRRRLLRHLGIQANRILVIAEGLLVFLAPANVTTLAKDIAETAAETRWAFDLVSPPLLRRFRRQWGRQLAPAGSHYQFGPGNGPDFFGPCGWRTVDVHSILKTAAQLGRLSPWMRLLAALPESAGARQWWPWSGVCVMQNDRSGASRSAQWRKAA
jgi:methyltransferase (TIGR00027 family)